MSIKNILIALVLILGILICGITLITSITQNFKVESSADYSHCYATSWGWLCPVNTNQGDVCYSGTYDGRLAISCVDNN